MPEKLQLLYMPCDNWTQKLQDLFND